MQSKITLTTDELGIIIRDHFIKQHKMSEDEWFSEILVKRDFENGKLNFTFTVEDI